MISDIFSAFGKFLSSVFAHISIWKVIILVENIFCFLAELELFYWLLIVNTIAPKVTYINW